MSDIIKRRGIFPSPVPEMSPAERLRELTRELEEIEQRRREIVAAIKKATNP